MKKFALMIAALATIFIAAPSINADAQTVVIKRGGHHHGYHRGTAPVPRCTTITAGTAAAPWRQGGRDQEALSSAIEARRQWPRKGPFFRRRTLPGEMARTQSAPDDVHRRTRPRCIAPFPQGGHQSHAGAKPGLTQRLSFGSAAIALHVLIVQPDVLRIEIGLLAFRARRFRDRGDAVLVEQPFQRHLRGAGAMLAADRHQRRVRRRPALRQRAIGHQRNRFGGEISGAAASGRASHDIRPGCRRSAP